MSRAVKSKIKIREVILRSLAYGLNNAGSDYRNGALYKLQKKLEQALDHVSEFDIDTIQKLATTYLKLAQLAIPTAAQEDAIKAGLVPVAPNRADEILARLEVHLLERRALLANAVPTSSQVIETKPISNSHANLRALAQHELVGRLVTQAPVQANESVTPPTGSGDGGVR